MAIQKHNRGRVISGVYVSDSGKVRTMTRNAFLRVLRRKGGGPKSSAKPERWRKARMPRKELPHAQA